MLAANALKHETESVQRGAQAEIDRLQQEADAAKDLLVQVLAEINDSTAAVTAA